MAARKPRVANDIWRPAFIRALASTGNVTLAAQAAQVDRGTVYKAMQSSRKFAADVHDARMMARDLLKAAAHRRAVVGVEEPVFGPGWVLEDPNNPESERKWGTTQVGTVRRYSDRLLEVLLRMDFPELLGTTRHINLTEEQVDAERERIQAEIERKRRPRPSPLQLPAAAPD